MVRMIDLPTGGAEFPDLAIVLPCLLDDEREELHKAAAECEMDSYEIRQIAYRPRLKIDGDPCHDPIRLANALRNGFMPDEAADDQGDEHDEYEPVQCVGCVEDLEADWKYCPRCGLRV